MTGISPSRLVLEVLAQTGIGITALQELFHVDIVPIDFRWLVTWTMIAAIILVAPKWWKLLFSGAAKLFSWLAWISAVFFTGVSNKCNKLSTWPDWLNKKLVRLRRKIGWFLLQPKSED